MTVHVPRRRPELVVLAGDGQLVAGWGADLEACGSPPTLVVGVHRADDEDQRLREQVDGGVRSVDSCPGRLPVRVL